MPRRNKIIVAAIVVLFVLTGFFREFVFLNWNEQMRVTYYNSPDPHVSPVMNWLGSFSYASLYYLKWPLTLLFTIAFAFLAVMAVHFAFNERKYIRVTVLAYAAVFVLSLLFFVAGWLIDDREATYTISRFLAGIIETPAMLAILMASFMIHRRL